MLRRLFHKQHETVVSFKGVKYIVYSDTPIDPAFLKALAPQPKVRRATITLSVVIALLAILIGIGTYFGFSQTNEYQRTLANQQTQYDDLKSDYDRLYARYEEIGNSNDELTQARQNYRTNVEQYQSTISQREEEIQQLQNLNKVYASALTDAYQALVGGTRDAARFEDSAYALWSDKQNGQTISLETLESHHSFASTVSDHLMTDRDQLGDFLKQYELPTGD